MDISSSQLQMLSQLRSQDSGSILRLRSALAWGIARFASTLFALEHQGLVARSANLLLLTPAGITELERSRRSATFASVRPPYMAEAAAPQLEVTALFLPHYKRFLRARDQSL